MLTADQMRILPDFFNDIADPRARSGRRHRLSTVLSIAAAATLCGMTGYKAMAGWAQDLGDKARERLGCRRVEGRYVVQMCIRDRAWVLHHALALRVLGFLVVDKPGLQFTRAQTICSHASQ